MPGPWRIVRNILLGGSLAAFFVGVGLHAYFGSTRPTAAAVEIGRVYALNHHGKYVFLTKGELTLFIAMFAAFVVGILVVLAIQVFAGRRGTHGDNR